MKAEKGCRVSVSYKLYVDDPSGELVEETSNDKPYEFVLGSGEQFEAFDKHILGLESGDEFSFAVSKEDAFGDIDEDAVIEIEKKVFEHDGKLDEKLFKMYAVLPMKDAEGNEYSGVIVAIGEDHVTLDFNHPLAGENIWFDGVVVDVTKV
jgi:FKBP-type peptidyl-prolyl cis-trans isomerase SlyD